MRSPASIETGFDSPPARGELDRDESSGETVGVAEHALDRRARLRLELEVDRGRHAEAAAEHPTGSVLLDELILDVVDEVRSRPSRSGKSHVLGARQRLGGPPLLCGCG